MDGLRAACGLGEAVSTGTRLKSAPAGAIAALISKLAQRAAYRYLHFLESGRMGGRGNTKRGGRGREGEGRERSIACPRPGLGWNL